MSFSDYLKRKRLLQGLSIRKLAAKASVSDAYLSQVETGKRGIPSPEVLEKLAPHLDVEYIELLKEAGYIDKDIVTKQIDLKEFAKENKQFASEKVLKMLEDEKGPQYMEVIADLWDKGLSPEKIKQIFDAMEDIFKNE